MPSMPDNRQASDFGRHRLPQALAILAELAPDLAALAAADLRLGQSADRRVALLLPHWTAPPRAPEAEVRRLRARLAAAVAQATGAPPADDGVPAYTVDFAALAPLAQGALGLIGALAAAYAPEAGAPAAQPARSFALLDARAAGAAADLAELVRRGRHLRLLGEAEGAPAPVLVELAAREEDGAGIDGLRAAGRAGAVLAWLAAYPTPGGTLLLPDTAAPPAEFRDRAGRVLAGLAAARLIPAGATIALVPGEDGRITAALLPEAALPAPPPAPPEPLQPLSLDLVRLEPPGPAAAALAAQVADRRFPLGYRVGLRPVPERLLAADAERLREQIEALQADLALIGAFGAPQLRLMRFSDAQLPAMVDALRALPPALVTGGALKYAAGHAKGRAGPAHFLLYEATETALEARLAEYRWRAATEDRPMAYWIDPFVAEAQAAAPGRTLVFVPAGTMLVPSPVQFGGTLDETLRLVLGGLFAEAGAVLDDPAAVPAFLFTPAADPGLDLEVEVIDRRGFAPLHLRLRWINDYLQVRSPQALPEGAREALAEALYSGAEARAVAAQAAAEAAAMRAAWEGQAAALSERIGALLAALTADAEASAQRLAQAAEWLRAADARLAALETLIDEAAAALAGAEAAWVPLPDLAEGLEPARERFWHLLTTRLDAGEAALAAAEARIAAHRRRVAAVLAWAHGR